MTAAQAALSGQHAVADHRRRYGQQGPTSVMPALPGPPAWFSPELIEIWRATVGAAPQGMLAGVDYANLIAYCVAVDMHHRLARQAAARRTSLPKELERRLRLAAAEVGRASKVLGITPYDRTRITIPPPPRAEPVDDPWATLRRYPTVIDGGKK